MAVTAISVSSVKRSLMFAESSLMFASTGRSLSARSQGSLVCALKLIMSAISAIPDISLLMANVSLKSRNQLGTL
jgi:hypothetical protein